MAAIPEYVKQTLLLGKDKRITQEGILIIKAQSYRTQEMNKQDAIDRLTEVLVEAGKLQKARRATKPSRNAQKKRVDSKVKSGRTKVLRKKVDF